MLYDALVIAAHLDDAEAKMAVPARSPRLSQPPKARTSSYLAPTSRHISLSEEIEMNHEGNTKTYTATPSLGLRIWAYFIAFGFLFLALMFWFFPLQTTGSLGTRFTTADSLADYRAVYGGLHLSIAAYMFFNLVRRRFVNVVFMAGLAAAGWALGRTYTMIIESAFTQTNIILLAPEAFGAVLSAFLLRGHVSEL